MTRWIVDGMNVIGSRPDGWWRDRTSAMARLVGALEDFAVCTGEPVTVVLDGRERDVGAPAHVTVVFAPQGGRDAADAVIGAIAERDHAPRELVVVTSDGELAARVRSAGTRVEPSGTFRARLDES
jgi:predicted RNA-binding protein with PIN domain